MDVSTELILKSMIINQPVDKIWWQWTTHEGLKTFFGYDNNIVLEPGGPYEIYFNEEKPEGFKGSEGCKVISFSPNKMLAFTWNSPPQFTGPRRSSSKTTVEIALKAISENQTEVTISHTNWPKEADWDEVFEYFDTAWDIVLNNLSRS